MAKSPARPDDKAPDGRADSAQPKQLFSTLLASKPQKEKRGVVVAVVFGHLILFTILWFTDPARKLRSKVYEMVTPIMLSEDEPVIVPLAEPEPPPPTREGAARPQQAAPASRPQSQATPPAERRENMPVGNPISSEPLIAPTNIPTDINRGAGAGGTLRDRLMGSAPNPTLMAPVDGAPPRVGPEAARFRIAERLGAFNDSIMAEAALAERNSDWTKTDAQGNRWGISPGKIHLGKITIPLNNNGENLFRPSDGRREEVANSLRSWSEINRQAAREDVKDSFEERVKEIRKRKEAERAAKTKPITNN